MSDNPNPLPEGQTPPGGTPDAGTGSPFKVSDSSLIDLGDGKPLPWSQIAKERLFHGDYTKKTQTLADERRAFDQERSQFTSQKEQVESLRQSIAGALGDPNKLMQLYMAAQMRASGQSQEPKPITQQDLQAYIERANQQADERFDKRISQFQQEQAQTAMAGQLQQLVMDGIAQHTRLKPWGSRIAGSVFEDVFKLVDSGTIPKTVEAVKQQIGVILQSFNDELVKSDEEARKADAVAKRKAATGVEPAGGKPVLPQKKKYKGKDDPELDKDMVEFLKNALATGEDDE